MAKGDVPINLTATPLVANAFLYTGGESFKRWVVRYVEGWIERTRNNNGITPDNVGLSGKTGEYTNGNWWGGYYGWKWPRGAQDIYRANTTGANTAQLLTGETRFFELPRSQLEMLHKLGRTENGVFRVPTRHDQRGWHMYAPEPAYPWLRLWLHTFDSRDRAALDRIRAERKGKFAGPDSEMDWFEFLEGRNPEYPVKQLERDLAFVQRKLDYIRNEHGDPETWVDSKWADADPMAMDGLVRLVLGGPAIDLRGEMLHCRLRYFDARTRHPGLPPGVAALVTKLEKDAVELELVNTNLEAGRAVVIQAGAYGEHRFINPGPGKWIEVELAPGAGGKLRFTMERYVNTPGFTQPWEASR